MTSSFERQQGNEAVWRSIFADGDPNLRKMHDLYRWLPRKPRCRLCKVPFAGIGGWLMRQRGKARNARNPNYCNACDQFLQAFPGGADVEMSILYVDIRQSTEYADGHDAAEVSERINAFLNQSIAIITEYDGFVHAFYGDCVVAAWAPGFCGPEHAAKSQRAALELVVKHRLESPSGEPIPVGVGVHTGEIYIGSVEAMEGTFRDVSIFGKNVNLTARLAARAARSQVLASRENIVAAGRDPANFEVETVELKGFSEPVDVYRLS